MKDTRTPRHRQRTRLPATAGRACCHRQRLLATALLLLASASALAAPRYDTVRIGESVYAEDGTFIHELRCKDGERRKALEYWDTEATPQRPLRTCTSRPNGETRCKEGVDVRAARDWVCDSDA